MGASGGVEAAAGGKGLMLLASVDEEVWGAGKGVGAVQRIEGGERCR